MTSHSATAGARPLFLLSLPRTGSTLVQRVLAAHPQISTAAEPWILLPLIYARSWKGIRAEYSQQIAAWGIRDFAHGLRGGSARFDARLRDFVEGLYQDASEDGATYFLDKTPRYYFIAEDLLRLFPEAKFLFLWRNPLSVITSMVETFRQNQFGPYAFPELFGAPAALASAFDANRERAYAVRFEDLLGPGRDEHWGGIFDYLGLDWNPQLLEQFGALEIRGRFGDPVGRHTYSGLSTEPLEKWKANLRGPVRQAWVARWLRQIGPEPLEIMGYDLERLLQEVRTAGPARPDAVALDLACLMGTGAGRLMRKRVLRVRDFPPLGFFSRLVRRLHGLLHS